MNSANIVSDYHIPVLLKETLEYLIWDRSGLYVDGTLGGGGHAKEILASLDSGGKLFAFDKDPDAIEYNRKKFADQLQMPQPKIVLVNMGFEEASSIEELNGNLSGILLDLGVSSKQFDSGENGMSFRFDTKLDMRFGNAGLSALDIINSYDEKELYILLKTLGEEPFARPIAKAIFKNKSGIQTTFQLRNLIEEIVPKKLFSKSLARVFQAFRIAVNNELNALDITISNCVPLLKVGGVCVIISYHSLEDRIVKQKFKEFEGEVKHINKYSTEEHKNNFKILTKNPILPSEQELTQNPRSRSAKLRVLRRVK